MTIQSKPKWRYARVSVAAWCLLTVCWLSSRCSSNKALEEETDAHTIPTLLSVVNEETGRYVYALENSLYEKLKNGVFLPAYKEDDSLDDAPEITLDRTEIGLGEPLQLSWTLGSTKTGQAVVDEKDVIILYCDEQMWNNDKRTFLDAATLQQAKVTSRKHFKEEFGDDGALGDTTWYFLSFPVVRREVCQFALYKTLPRNTFALLATTEFLRIKDGKTSPTAIHLALSDSIDEIVVQFKTGSTGGTPTVKYGVDQESMQLTARGTSHTYTSEDMCQKPATEEEPGKFIPPGQLHVVRLQHLEHNTRYHYKVGVEEAGVTATWSEPFSFLSAPQAKANPEPWSYIVFGDQGCPSDGWGQGGAWTAAMTAREVEGGPDSLPIRSVHHFGDLSYARGAAHIWDEWLNMISSFTTRVPLMIAVGNHEYDHTNGGGNGKDPSGVPTPGGYHPIWGNFHKDSDGECGVPTANHFTMPNSTNSNGVFWYSFDYVNLHTTVISSEHDLSPGSDQYKWLEDDLRSVDRAKFPWLVLELHRPLYESEADPINGLVGVEIRHRIEHLLKKYQVDLVLAGHYHSYQRSCSGLYKKKCSNGGPTHLTIGTAGAHLLSAPLMPHTKWRTKFIRDTYGYGRITVANSSALHFEFVKAGGSNDAEAGRVLDEAWLLKDPLGRHSGAAAQ